MKYFIDTEFMEDGKTIDLLSIAVVREDGKEFYCESSEADFGKANQFVKENIIPQLWSLQPDKKEFNAWIRDGGKGGLLTRKEIARELRIFVSESDDKPYFWGYYSAYDWVATCQLFGSMINLPEGWPMFCRDIIQECKRLGNPDLPKTGKGEHHALIDARWNRLAFGFLLSEQFRQDARFKESIISEMKK